MSVPSGPSSPSALGVGAQHLDGQLALEPGVPRAPHLAARARAQRLEQVPPAIEVIATALRRERQDDLEQLRAHLPSDDVVARTERLRRALTRPLYDRWFEVVMLLSTWDRETLPAAIAVAEEGL